ncbi:MAG: HD domain-containing protein [Gelidibacter sp.]
MDNSYTKIYNHVIATLTEQLPDDLTYHCVSHTLYVLEKTIYIATKEHVSETDLRLLKIAALYHDIGFIKTNFEHEANGCEITRNDLKAFKIPKKDIDIICGMILATKIPQRPKTHLEAILADADLEYLGTKHFKKVSELLYQELKYFNKDLSRKEWRAIQIDFMTKHHYHTKFCKHYKSHRKLKNMESINLLK